jgi:hypothetical protein
MTLKVAAFLLLASASVFAFDPVGPPPEKTVRWTTHFLSTQTCPTVVIKDTPIIEALELIQAGQSRPPEYAVSMDGSLMGPVTDVRITIETETVTFLELLARLADQANADLLIKSGTVMLVPKKSKD